MRCSKNSNYFIHANNVVIDINNLKTIFFFKLNTFNIITHIYALKHIIINGVSMCLSLKTVIF